jgi:4-amino-4-deoxy-L-arabinose transferase-like glycosyltransferase
MLKKLKSEVRKHRLIYLALFVILLAATFVRVYNVGTNLGFYFDQGRDALVIWDFWKNGNLFLIGPTTGIAGVFRGPWYYWLITPAYILGQGNPVFPAVFLSLTTVAAIFFLYLTAKELGNPVAGLIAGIITAFSYYIVVHSKWLSNPTPMLLISIMLLWALIRFVRGKGGNYAFPLIGFLAGMAIQFGSASEIFYLPIIFIITIWKRKYLPNKKVLALSFVLFFISFVPQILFDALKGGVLSSAIIKFLFNEQSFKLSFWEVVGIRLSQYYQLFTSIITLAPFSYTLPFIFLGLGIIWASPKKFIQNDGFEVLLIFLLVPLVGMIFFQGNYGNVFDYYFSGLYFPAILLFSLPFGLAFRNWGGKIAVFTFFVLFFQANTPVLANYLVHTRAPFTFDDQKRAIEWIYENAGNEKFNVDVYVPPVIPHAYDYLLKWLPSTRDISLGTSGPRQVEEQVPLLFTLYELDPPSPGRLEAWLTRQSTIGKVESEASFGAITVQRRERL